MWLRVSAGSTRGEFGWPPSQGGGRCECGGVGGPGLRAVARRARAPRRADPDQEGRWQKASRSRWSQQGTRQGCGEVAGQRRWSRSSAGSWSPARPSGRSDGPRRWPAGVGPRTGKPVTAWGATCAGRPRRASTAATRPSTRACSWATRNRLRASARPGRLFEDTRKVARESGAMKDRARVLDSTGLYDAVATQTP
jgi:hypothetical protein